MSEAFQIHVLTQDVDGAGLDQGDGKLRASAMGGENPVVRGDVCRESGLTPPKYRFGGGVEVGGIEPHVDDDGRGRLLH